MDETGPIRFSRSCSSLLERDRLEKCSETRAYCQKVRFRLCDSPDIAKSPGTKQNLLKESAVVFNSPKGLLDLSDVGDVSAVKSRIESRLAGNQQRKGWKVSRKRRKRSRKRNGESTRLRKRRRLVIRIAFLWDQRLQERVMCVVNSRKNLHEQRRISGSHLRRKHNVEQEASDLCARARVFQRRRKTNIGKGLSVISASDLPSRSIRRVVGVSFKTNAVNDNLAEEGTYTPNDSIKRYGNALMKIDSIPKAIRSARDTTEKSVGGVTSRESVLLQRELTTPECARAQVYIRNSNRLTGNVTKIVRPLSESERRRRMQELYGLSATGADRERSYLQRQCIIRRPRELRKSFLRLDAGRYMPKQVCLGKSEIHGFGLFVLERLQRGDFVIEYKGEIIPMRLADERERRRKELGLHELYTFLLKRVAGKDYLIDASYKGNVSRYLNHCCEPNVEARKIIYRGNTHIAFFSLKDIEEREELKFDYAFAYEDGEKKVPCFCRAKNCRKYI